MTVQLLGALGGGLIGLAAAFLVISFQPWHPRLEDGLHGAGDVGSFEEHPALRGRVCLVRGSAHCDLLPRLTGRILKGRLHHVAAGAAPGLSPSSRGAAVTRTLQEHTERSVRALADR